MKAKFPSCRSVLIVVVVFALATIGVVVRRRRIRRAEALDAKVVSIDSRRRAGTMSRSRAAGLPR